MMQPVMSSFSLAPTSNSGITGAVGHISVYGSTSWIIMVASHIGATLLDEVRRGGLRQGNKRNKISRI